MQEKYYINLYEFTTYINTNQTYGCVQRGGQGACTPFSYLATNIIIWVTFIEKMILFALVLLKFYVFPPRLSWTMFPSYGEKSVDIPKAMKTF